MTTSGYPGAPAAPPPPDAPAGPGGRGLFGWMGRNPKRGFWITALVALAIGIVIGAVGANGQSEIDKQKSRAEKAESELSAARDQEDALQTRAHNAEGQVVVLQRRVKRLSANGRVPSFIGDDVFDAENSGVVHSYGWKTDYTEQISNQPVGTILSQSPSAGTTLKYGQKITFVVAKKPPPKPKQWVTVKTLTGAGSTKTDEFTIPSGKVRLQYNMPEDGNNAIELYRRPREYVDLLLNEIGPQSGSTRLYERGSGYYLDITGSYTIQVQVFKRPQ